MRGIRVGGKLERRELYRVGRGGREDGRMVSSLSLDREFPSREGRVR